MDEQYFTHYGLNQDPFADVKQDKEYFATPELEHRIELIKHLIEFSDRILVVTGEVGSGKTSLLNHLLHQHDEKWQLCKLSFNNINTTEDFFKQIYLDQGLEFRELDSYASKVHSLHDSFEALQEKGYVPVLFIDDAHYLSIEVLKLLFELAITEQKKSALHIVLFSETNIAQLVNHKNLGFIHSLDMPLFSEEQIADYLNHRLSVSGYQGTGIIEQKLVNNIHKTSNGLPGLINELASKALQDPAIHRQDNNYFETLKSYALNPKYTLPTALLLSALFIIYILQSEETVDDTEIQSTEISLPTQTIQQEAEDITAADDVINIEAEESEVIVPEETDKQEQAAETDIVLLNTDGEIIYQAQNQKPNDPVKENTLNEENIKSKDIENKEQVEEKPIAEKSETITTQAETEIKPKPTETTPPELIQDIEPVTTVNKLEKPVPPPDPPKVEQPKETKPVVAKQTISPGSIRGTDWIKQQSANHYVLQLMGAHDGTAMNKFIQKHNQYQQQLAKFTTVNQNKTWHVLVYGIYPNREQAVAAIATLPPVFRDLNPWPRKIATIQQDL